MSWKFPENTSMTMTTREVTIFLAELGQLRQDFGKALARLDGFSAKFEAVAQLFDRVSNLERSVELCQEACGRERGQRRSILHWIAYAVAGLAPGAATWYLTRSVRP